MPITKLKKTEITREYVIEVIIEPDEDICHAYCPILRGCHTWGHTEKEAFKFIQEAVKLHLEDMIDDGEVIPGIGIMDTVDHLNLVFEDKPVINGELYEVPEMSA